MRLSRERVIDALPTELEPGVTLDWHEYASLWARGVSPDILRRARQKMERPKSITLDELAAVLFGPSPSRYQVESVRRSAKTLARHGRAVIAYRVIGGRRHVTVRRPSVQPAPKPRNSPNPKCLECGRRFKPSGQAAWWAFRQGRVVPVGDKRRYCSNACRQRAYRRRLKSPAPVLPPRDSFGRFIAPER